MPRPDRPVWIAGAVLAAVALAGVLMMGERHAPVAPGAGADAGRFGATAGMAKACGWLAADDLRLIRAYVKSHAEDQGGHAGRAAQRFERAFTAHDQLLGDAVDCDAVLPRYRDLLKAAGGGEPGLGV